MASSFAKLRRYCLGLAVLLVLSAALPPCLLAKSSRYVLGTEERMPASPRIYGISEEVPVNPLYLGHLRGACPEALYL